MRLAQYTSSSPLVWLLLISRNELVIAVIQLRTSILPRPPPRRITFVFNVVFTER